MQHRINGIIQQLNCINVGFVPVTNRWRSDAHAATALCHSESDVRREHSGALKNERRSSSDAEVGVLTTITDHGPTPPEGGTYYHWRRDLSSSLLYPQEKRDPLTYPAASHPHTCGALIRGRLLKGKHKTEKQTFSWKSTFMMSDRIERIKILESQFHRSVCKSGREFSINNHFASMGNSLSCLRGTPY
ncbi:hypothetical protein AVEN_158358-1 [Araneus ventricosus]|uniref:Uncharacterized protein n=1 Tax=Araneus ventricosus TaxID=182803 RepID=A0A4Y2FAS6_ARAVE|nr:hypothetical protein AVEN_158358-1 [Araneus ventricosus]